MWRLISLQSGLKINTFFNVPLLIHPSWLLFWALVGYLAAVEYAPSTYPEQDPPHRWLQAVLTNALLFGSVVLHEAAHLLVALRARLPLQRVVLFPFGGTKTRGPEELSWRAELVLAGVGPLASLAIALILLFAAPAEAQPVATWVGIFNLILATLNLLPAAPLDGAGIVQALGRGRTSAFKLARFTFGAGDFISTVLVWLGLPLVIIGGAVEGLLLVLFGCLFQIAGNVYLLKENPWQKRLLRQTPLARIVAKARLDHGRSTLLPGHEVPEWPQLAFPQGVSDGATLPMPISPSLARWSLPAGSTLLEALHRLDRPEAPAHLFVVDDYHIIGICTRADLLDYLFEQKDAVDLRW